MHFEEALGSFKSELSKAGFNTPVRWLSAEQMYLTSEVLYIRESQTTTEAEVEKAFNSLSGEVGTLVLVAKVEETIYCSLLMRSFDSDKDIELGNGEFYLHIDPCVQKIEAVDAKLKWLFLKMFPFGRIFSSLDYAFEVKRKSRK